MTESSAWGPGYSQAELDAAQERFALRFPPDLVELLREKRLLRGYDWIDDDDKIRAALAWPLQGFLFDIEHSLLWWPEWGERPDSLSERAAIIRRVVSEAPKLIPIFGHRYIPEEPHERGNPVFSVYQADIIHYGSDLASYFSNELSGQYELADNIKRIRFWSDAVDRNGDPAYGWSDAPGVGHPFATGGPRSD